MDRANLPHVVTVAFAAVVVAVMWLYLPKNRQLWLAAMLVLVAAIFLNVRLKI